MPNRLRVLLLGCCAVLAVPIAAKAQNSANTSAMAQTPNDVSAAGASGGGAPAPAPQATTLTDIVVTAQKREQSVQKVPINITAFSAGRLDTLSINDVQDLTAYVPSFRVTEPGDPAVSALSLRGVGQRDINVHNEGAVALFVDGGYVSFIPAIGQPIFDVSRVEVLKGPQGTLFGRNATGGLISIITNQPSQTFSAYAKLEYGSYNDVKAEGAVGGPITSTLSARVSVAYDYSDGYIKNADGPSLNGQNSLATRLQLRWDPISTFHYTLSLHDWRSFPNAGVSVAPTPFIETASGVTRPTSSARYAAYCASITGGAIPTPAEAWRSGNCFTNQSNPFDASVGPQSRYEQSYYGLTGTGEWELGRGITLSSITDYQHLSNEFVVDENATAANLFDYEINDKGSSQVSQELRLNGAAETLKWVTGLYYLDIDHNILNVTNLYNDPGFGVLLPAAYQQHTQSFAIFGQGDYDLTRQLTVSLGLRGINDSKSMHNVSTCVSNPLAPPSLCAILGSVVYPGALAFNRTYDGSFSAESWSGRAVLQYKPTDLVMVYGGVTRGAKGGGFNAGGAEFYSFSEVEFKPETLTDYEVGVKASTPDHRLSFDGSTFYYDYHDYQSFAATTDGGLRILNVNAEVKGVEAAVTARPFGGLTLYGAATYLDTLQKNVPLPAGGTGRFQMPDAPRWSLNGEARYVFALPKGDELALQLNGVYVGKRSISAIDYPDERIPAYTRLDARVSYRLPGGHITLAAFCNNFTNEKIIATRVDFVGQTGAAVDTLDPPRMFGASLTYRY